MSRKLLLTLFIAASLLADVQSRPKGKIAENTYLNCIPFCSANSLVLSIVWTPKEKLFAILQSLSNHRNYLQWQTISIITWNSEVRVFKSDSYYENT